MRVGLGQVRGGNMAPVAATEARLVFTGDLFSSGSIGALSIVEAVLGRGAICETESLGIMPVDVEDSAVAGRLMVKFPASSVGTFALTSHFMASW